MNSAPLAKTGQRRQLLNGICKHQTTTFQKHLKVFCSISISVSITVNVNSIIEILNTYKLCSINTRNRISYFIFHKVLAFIEFLNLINVNYYAQLGALNLGVTRPPLYILSRIRACV